MSPQNQNADNVVNTIQPPMFWHDPIYKQRQTGKTQKMEESGWRTRVKLLHHPNAYRASFQNMVLELQHMWNGQLFRVRAAKHHIQLSSADELQISPALY